MDSEDKRRIGDLSIAFPRLVMYPIGKPGVKSQAKKVGRSAELLEPDSAVLMTQQQKGLTCFLHISSSNAKQAPNHTNKAASICIMDWGLRLYDDPIQHYEEFYQAVPNEGEGGNVDENDGSDDGEESDLGSVIGFKDVILSDNEDPNVIVVEDGGVNVGEGGANVGEEARNQNVEDEWSDMEKSDDLRSLNSDEENGGPKFPEFNVEREMEDPKFELSQLFACAGEFKRAVAEYFILHRKQIKLYTNKNYRVRAKYSLPCEWMVYVTSRVKGKETVTPRFLDLEYSLIHTYSTIQLPGGPTAGPSRRGKGRGSDSGGALGRGRGGGSGSGSGRGGAAIGRGIRGGSGSATVRRGSDRGGFTTAAELQRMARERYQRTRMVAYGIKADPRLLSRDVWILRVGSVFSLTRTLGI
ncbi:hypothetical protein LguiB_000884 [Lonicera macranthoides]